MSTHTDQNRKQRDREEVISLTKRLVQIPSVYRPEHPHANEEQAALFVADYLKKWGLRFTLKKWRKEDPMLLES